MCGSPRRLGLNPGVGDGQAKSIHTGDAHRAVGSVNGSDPNSALGHALRKPGMIRDKPGMSRRGKTRCQPLARAFRSRLNSHHGREGPPLAYETAATKVSSRQGSCLQPSSAHNCSKRSSGSQRRSWSGCVMPRRLSFLATAGPTLGIDCTSLVMMLDDRAGRARRSWRNRTPGSTIVRRRVCRHPFDA
jgi:hypothetical protein